MCSWDNTRLSCSETTCHDEGARSFCLCHGRPWCRSHRDECEQATADSSPALARLRALIRPRRPVLA
jgi:hypothetical protein